MNKITVAFRLVQWDNPERQPCEAAGVRRALCGVVATRLAIYGPADDIRLCEEHAMLVLAHETRPR